MLLRYSNKHFFTVCCSGLLTKIKHAASEFGQQCENLMKPSLQDTFEPKIIRKGEKKQNKKKKQEIILSSVIHYQSKDCNN